VTPDLSIIIPVYNRGELIRYTLESVRRASAGLAVEVIIVDDGSETPFEKTLANSHYRPGKILRQTNQGLLFARLAGLAIATGRHALFLDSDDLVSPEKLRVQTSVMDAMQADVSYTDTSRCVIEGDYDALTFAADTPCADTSDAAEFFITVQPALHSPVFRTDYLREVVAGAFFPPSILYNPVAEIWFYHNAAPRPARVVKVPGPHTIIGQHAGARLTNHWERLGVASLGVQEAFARSCPNTPETSAVRQLFAEMAFNSWRRLPRGFSPEFCARRLALWTQCSSTVRPEKLGGRVFQKLTRLVGPVNAGKLLRRLQNGTYAGCRSMDDEALRRLLGALPSQ